jgi:periplasmic protein TonB
MTEHRLATDDDLKLAPPPRARALVAALVLMLHVVALLGLIRAFAPDFTAEVADRVLATFTVTVVTPPPSPPPEKAPDKAGAAAEIGKKAVPREVAAPRVPCSSAATRAGTAHRCP